MVNPDRFIRREGLQRRGYEHLRKGRYYRVVLLDESGRRRDPYVGRLDSEDFLRVRQSPEHNWAYVRRHPVIDDFEILL